MVLRLESILDLGITLTEGLRPDVTFTTSVPELLNFLVFLHALPRTLMIPLPSEQKIMRSQFLEYSSVKCGHLTK